MRFVSKAKPALAVLPLVTFLLLSACAKLPFAPPGPGEAVRGAMSAAAQGKLEEMAKYMPEAEQAKAESKDSFLGSLGSSHREGVYQTNDRGNAAGSEQQGRHHSD